MLACLLGRVYCRKCRQSLFSSAELAPRPFDFSHSRQGDTHSAVTPLAHKRKRLSRAHSHTRKEPASHYRVPAVQANFDILLGQLQCSSGFRPLLFGHAYRKSRTSDTGETNFPLLK